MKPSSQPRRVGKISSSHHRMALAEVPGILARSRK